MAVTNPKYFWFLVKAVLIIGAANLFRLLPSFILMKNFATELLGGYPNIQTMLLSLINVAPIGSFTSFGGLSTGRIGQWEATMYVGLAGAVFLIFWGVVNFIRDQEIPLETRRLILPVLGLALFTFDRFYLYFETIVRIPIFTAERVPTRIFSLVLCFLIVLASVQFQNWLAKSGRSNLALYMALILVLFGINDLWVNFQLLALPASASAFPITGFDPSAWVVQDTFRNMTYIYLILIGLGITLGTLTFVSFKGILEKRRVNLQK